MAHAHLFIKFVQLPIPEVHHLYTTGNIPLAAGYLAAYALRMGVLQPGQLEIIPREIVNLGGDAAIIQWVLQGKTDMVCFTTTMWNLERNLYLAQHIKKSKPAIAIIFGGPEITADNPIINDSTALRIVDSFVLGEGEQTFVELVRHYQSGTGLQPVYQEREPLALSQVPNPYLEAILVPQAGESLYIETMRGCPYPCKYCFYSKANATMRYFPDEFLPRLFELARLYQVPEVYIMDPSFNVAPDLMKKLEHISALNTTSIPIHTEIRLESLTPDITRAMQAAGFKSVEAGLQSTCEKSLKAISRSWHRGKFIQGAHLLAAAGIDVKTGVILGLPFDGLHDFEKTIQFVKQLGIEESMEIYPLSLLPGTRLRDEAAAYGIVYMAEPPYWVLRTPYMDEREISRTIEMVEEKLAIEFFPPIIPLFNSVHPTYTHFLDLRKEATAQLVELYQHPERVGHSLTLLVNRTTGFAPLIELGKWLQQENPFTLVQLVLDQERIPMEAELAPLKEAFYRPQHYFNRIHHYKIDLQGIYSLRFFHLTADPEVADTYLYEAQYCDLVLLYTPPLLQRGCDILEAKPILWVDSPLTKAAEKKINSIYEGFEEFLIIQNIAN